MRWAETLQPSSPFVVHAFPSLTGAPTLPVIGKLPAVENAPSSLQSSQSKVGLAEASSPPALVLVQASTPELTSSPFSSSPIGFCGIVWSAARLAKRSVKRSVTAQGPFPGTRESAEVVLSESHAFHSPCRGQPDPARSVASVDQLLQRVVVAKVEAFLKLVRRAIAAREGSQALASIVTAANFERALGALGQFFCVGA